MRPAVWPLLAVLALAAAGQSVQSADTTLQKALDRLYADVLSSGRNHATAQKIRDMVLASPTYTAMLSGDGNARGCRESLDTCRNPT